MPLPEATVQPLPAPAADPVAPPAAAAQQGRRQESGSMLPWIIVGALVLGALALFALRRRRPAPVYRNRRYDTPIAPTPAATPVVLTGADQPERPWLELLLQPARAGVEGEDAVVEFLLTIDNRGSAPAEDVRISTWLVAGGDAQGAEIERAPAAELPSAIPAGEGRSIQTQVALPTGGMGRDAILPVVVAEARYTLPDGREGRTSASFAVGVPDGEELAHFSIREPSGLHEGVIARPLGEPERA
jgi:MYXO-CTERM domain-containing protein